MAFLQSGLKRMLAFVVVSHIGVFLSAIGLLTARGLAAATVYVVADGLVKGALFCAVAHVAVRLGTTRELEAHGRGRGLPVTGSVVAIGALGLAVLPPLGTFVAASVFFRSAGGIGYGWLPPVLVVATALTGGAVLRAAARIFLGLGPQSDELLEDLPDEGEESGRGPTHAGAVFWIPALALLVAGLGLGFVPGLPAQAIAHASHFVDRPAMAAETLHGAPAPPLEVPSFSPSAGSYVYGLVSALGAIALAWLGLRRLRLGRAAKVVIERLELVHEGVVTDYVTWLTLGTAVLGGLFALAVR